jgi:hypothetical protein
VKKVLGFALLMLLCVPLALAQAPLTQQFTIVPVPVPPAVINSQTASNTAGTGVSTSTTGGSIAAGAYRICVQYYTISNLGGDCSVDTAATSVVTTTGTTSSITVQAPNTLNAPGSVAGWRPWIGLNGGAAAAEGLVVLTSVICPLSASTTPSCALGQPAVLTAAPASGTAPATHLAFFPPITNAANQSLFENSLYTYRVINWVVTGTAPATCTFNFQTGTAPSTLASVGQTITCTSSGSYAVPNGVATAYSGINLATYSLTDLTTNVAFYVTEYQFPPVPIWFGNAAPTAACGTAVAAVGFYIDTAVPSLIYTCVTTTWTAVTLP